MNEVTPRPVCYLDARTGHPVRAMVVAATDDGARVCLETAESAFEALLLRPAAPGAAGHRALDNEIIAGRWRWRCLAGRPHPAEVSALIGHHVPGAEPFALVEPYRGGPCGAEAGRLLPQDLRRFQTSLLAGVRLLAVAGIAHRALNPWTVRWDGRQAQITDFAHAALLGEPRTAGGAPPWCAPEQRPDQVGGDVGDRDDLWAAGGLLVYMATGEEHREPDTASLPPELERLVDGLFLPPAERPDTAEMLRRVEAAEPVPYAPEPDPGLVAGRREFFEVRAAKHPPKVPPPEVREGAFTRFAAWLARLVRRWHLGPSPHWVWIGASAIVLLVLSARLIGG
ncbi:hypothetical protein [Actinomadura terrae]|uniref:hypothetical protein n=1 Tax=Actinomadura terrae TaxID=604353 RepID=UPI001FA6FDBE|nr:hypothetical protein [Actinomadura terrae]